MTVVARGDGRCHESHEQEMNRGVYVHCTGAALLLLCNGCGPKEQTVFVNLDQVASTETIPNVQVIPNPTPPPVFGRSSLTFPALPAAKYSLGADQQRIKDVQSVIEANRAALTQEIRNRLQANYTKDIEIGRAHV